MDYGTISIFMHHGLSHDQRCSVVRQNVENQLVTSNRTHFNEILHNCTEISKLEVPVTVSWNVSAYRYILKIEMFD